MVNTLCDGKKHIVNITKYLFCESNKYFVTKNNAWGTLQPFVDNGIFTFHVNEKEEILPCIQMKENTIDYDIDYAFDGEDEYPVESINERMKIKYIPINKCPFCGEDIEFFIDNVVDCREEEKELVEEIEVIESKRKRLGVRDTRTLFVLSQKLRELRKEGYFYAENETLIESPKYEIYIESDF